MKKISLLGWLVFCLALLAQAQNTETDTDKKAIRQVMADQEAAWNRADLEGFMQGYWKSDSLRFIGSRGLTYGWQATLDNYKKSYPGAEAMGKLTLGIVSLEMLSPENAFMIGKWRLVRTKDELSGHFTLLWRKVNGKWVVVADHSS